MFSFAMKGSQNNDNNEMNKNTIRTSRFMWKPMKGKKSEIEEENFAILNSNCI